MNVKTIMIILFFSIFIFCGLVFSEDDFVEDVTPVVSEPIQGQTSVKSMQQNKTTSRRWLLSVGIRRFADTRIAPLTYTANDAKSMADYFSKDNVPDTQMILLLDESATRNNIVEALNNIKGQISAEDTFLFFFSSHGQGDNTGNTFFVTFDTVLDDLSRTAIPMQHIKEIVQNFGCLNVVLMADTCHSGGVKSLKQQNAEDYNKIVRAAGKQTRVALLTSSRTHETSMESPEWGHGAFTYYILKGLAGEADNFPKDGNVSITELFDHVMIAVPRATNRAQHPSGKFSYNWPGKKEDAVVFGSTLKSVSPNGNTDRNQGGKEVGGSQGDDWNSILHE